MIEAICCSATVGSGAGLGAAGKGSPAAWQGDRALPSSMWAKFRGMQRSLMAFGSLLMITLLCAGSKAAPAAHAIESTIVVPRPADLSGWEDARTERIPTSVHHVWDVYAARDDIEFYSDLEKLERGGPGDRITVCSTAPLKRFVVAEVDRARRAFRLVEGATQVIPYFVAKRHCEWARADDFLLVDAPAADENSGIRKKVITLSDWRMLKSTQFGSEDWTRVFQYATLYSRPKRDRRFRRGGLNMAEFAYVFKQVQTGDETWFFVSATSSLPVTQREIDRPTWGWVPKTAVIRWDTAEAVWPDWHRTRAAHVYATQTDLLRAVDRPDSVDGIIARDVRFEESDSAPRSPKRPIAGMMPHPIVNLGVDLNACRRRGIECARVIYIGALAFDGTPVERRGGLTDDGTVGDFDRTRELMDRGKEIMLRAASNVNVVFVIDGTQSFLPFIHSVTEAISVLAREVQVIREALDEGAKLRFGAVVYRDNYAGARRIVSYQLTEKLLELAHQVARERATAYDRDNYDEALFCGLTEAHKLIARVLGSQEHLNVVVTVGDRKSERGRDCGPTTSHAVRALSEVSPMMMLGLGVQHSDADLVGFERDIKNVFAQAGTENGVCEMRHFGENESAEMALFIQDKMTELVEKVRAYGREADRCIVGVGCANPSPRRSAIGSEQREPQMQDIRGYRMTPIVRGITINRLRVEAGLTAGEARDIWNKIHSRHATIHVVGWALLTDKRRENVMRKVVLFDADGVHEYGARLKELIHQRDAVAFIEAWSDTCGRVTREADVFARGTCDRFRYGITQVGLHPLLRKSRSEIRAWFDVEASREQTRKAHKVIDKMDGAARTVLQRLESHKNSDDAALWFRASGGSEKKYIWLLQEELL